MPGTRATYPLPDGSYAFAPFGELLTDLDEQRVRCHLCGGWYARLGPHLRAHETNVREYRERFGLRAQRPLQAPELSVRAAEQLRARMATDERVQLGMARGHALARSGELPAMGTAAHASAAFVGERAASARRSGERLGAREAERNLQRRARRAVERGFDDLETYLRSRYVQQHARVADIAADLGVAETTVVADLERAGISRRPREERLALGREELARRRRDTIERLHQRAVSAGFDSMRDYLRDRVARRWRLADIAAERERTSYAYAT